MPNNFSVSIVEQLFVNGNLQRFKTEASIDNVNYSDRRTVNVPANAPIDLIKFDALVANGQFVLSNVVYLRVTNLDSTYDLRLRVFVTGNDTYDILVKPKESYILSSPLMNTSDSQADFSGFQNPDTVQAQANVTSPPVGFTGINVEYLLVSL